MGNFWRDDLGLGTHRWDISASWSLKFRESVLRKKPGLIFGTNMVVVHISMYTVLVCVCEYLLVLCKDRCIQIIYDGLFIDSSYGML